ncbi:ferritin family protein [Thermodesulfobacteriota bacterium]
MEFDTLEAIIDFAIEKEMEAAEFYSTLSEEEDFAGSSKMFKEFSDEEHKHEKMLKDFKNHGITKSTEEYNFQWMSDLKRSDYLIDIDFQKGMTYDKILRLAMKREEKSLKLYNDFQNHVDTDVARKIFKVLCQEEAKHKLALETMYDDYMAKMGD